jgi:hypothetical protein
VGNAAQVTVSHIRRENKQGHFTSLHGQHGQVESQDYLVAANFKRLDLEWRARR